MIYNRKTKIYTEETTYGSSLLSFLYGTSIGTVLLQRIVIQPWFSKAVGLYYASRFSKKKIKPFLKAYGIEMDLYEQRKYVSFDDFFGRKMKEELRPKCENKNVLIAPCSAKLTVYPIDPNQRIMIKGNYYTVAELLRDDKLAHAYGNGLCMVFRLTVDDYHRYCFIDDGVMGKIEKIKGYFHTVGHISAKDYRVFAENSREYTILHTEHFGEVICMEVGAILVGKINNHLRITSFEKGMEKGYFSFGGSTIVLFFKPNTIQVDQDIMEASRAGYETKICIYERIGCKKIVKTD